MNEFKKKKITKNTANLILFILLQVLTEKIVQTRPECPI